MKIDETKKFMDFITYLRISNTNKILHISGGTERNIKSNGSKIFPDEILKIMTVRRIEFYILRTYFLFRIFIESYVYEKNLQKNSEAL